MVKKESKTVKNPESVPDEDLAPSPEMLTSKQEVADELKMSLYRFEQLLRRYPFANCGAPGKIRGRWTTTKEDAWRWFRYVQRQESRHPDARRMRPEEPPELCGIRGR